MFVRSLRHSVLAKTRAKGLQYQRAGAVIDIDGAEWIVHAVVRGGQDYRVEIVRDHEGFLGSCDCPYFADREEICKHIWAALLEAEQRGLLIGDGTLPPQPFLEPDYHLLGRPSPIPAKSDPKARAPEWQRFLTDLQQRLQAEERATPQARFANSELIYVIDVAQALAGRGIVLTLMQRQRKKNGDWAKPKPATVSLSEIDHLPVPEDREILSLLLGAVDQIGFQSSAYFGQSYPGRGTYVLGKSVAIRVLPLLAQTGRLHLVIQTDPELVPIAWDGGESWRFELATTIAPNGDITFGGSLVRDGSTMPLSEPVLLLADGFLFTRTSLARFDASSPFAWVAQLRRSGNVTFPGIAADSVVEALARSGVSPEHVPEGLRYEIVAVSPQATVKLARTDSRYAYSVRDTLGAVVLFDYEGTLIGADPAAVYDAARRRLIRRDVAAEQRAIARLHQLGFHQVWDYAQSKQALGIAVEQFPRAVRTLVKEGWRVEAEGRLFRAPRNMKLRVASGIDWFELHGQVDFGDGVSASLPDLLAAFRRGEGTVVLDDGTRGLVPEEWLRRCAGIARFGEAAADHVRFRSSQAVLLDALLASQPAVAVDEAFARVRTALQSFEGIAPVDAPDSFAGALREYQRDALGWFAFLRQFGFGGCLADDMGLGKTVMVIALLESRRRALNAGNRQASLAVVPRSLVFNWMDEARRFAPELRMLDYTGTTREFELIDQHDLVLTTYGTLRRDVTLLKEVPFDYVILDEAQAVKNSATAAAKAVRLLNARHRLALSGTPIENHIGELWSLFEFLNPGFLGSARGFEAAIGKRNHADGDDLPIVAKALRPFVLRRTKEQVAPELPERSEQTIHCELEGAQRRLYDELRTRYRRSLLARISRSGINRSKIQVLEALLRLRQAACHPALVDEARGADPSAKLDVLLPRLGEVIEERHKALVFSQFTSFLALLRARLDREGVVYEYLDGQTRDRAARVERFQRDGGCPVFLISLKAGGLGLNLTAAEYVFLLDPWWNPAVEAQAIDRAHRIGQTRHVFAYRLIARDTIEEKVAELQHSKRELAEAILSADAGLIRDLKPEDVEWLLS